MDDIKLHFLVFDNLKNMVIKVLILTHYKHSLKTIVETDFFYFVNSRKFSFLRKNRLLHSIIFFFKDLNPIKSNYEIYKKELLVII